MKSMRIVLGCLLAMSGPASAQWQHEEIEGVSGEQTPHSAGIHSGGYSFSLVCRGERIRTLFLHFDRSGSYDLEEIRILNDEKSKMRIWVDDGPVIDLDVILHVDVGRNVGLIRGSADGDVSLLTAIRDAKDRVAVVLDLPGGNFNLQVFGVGGAGDAVQKMISGCDLKE